jgi:hypothetical protein
MNESDVKLAMSKSMKAAGAYARRLEDSYAVGIFDMLLIPRGLPVFAAEVKMVKSNIFGPSPRQQIELARVEDVAGDQGHIIPVMIGYKDRTFYFHKPQTKINIKDCFSITTSEVPFHDQLVKYYHFLRGSK